MTVPVKACERVTLLSRRNFGIELQARCSGKGFTSALAPLPQQGSLTLPHCSIAQPERVNLKF